MSLVGLEEILNDPFQLIQLTRKGIDYPIFQMIAIASPFSNKEWSSFLHLTERTLQRYKKESKKFEPIHSERILEIAQLQKKGEEVFGDSQNFNQWMDSNIIALGGIKPKSLLDNTFGISLLNDELIRIEYGVLA